MRKLVLTLICLAALSGAAFAQDDHCDACATQVGYAVVTANITGPNGVAPGGLVAFETLGFRSQVPALQAGVLSAVMSTRLNLFASASIRVSPNVGVGITNPALTPAVVTMTLRDSGGHFAASNILTIGPGQQTAKFISEYFAAVANLTPDFAGTLTVTSNTPVAIMALLFSGTTFSTIPVNNVSPTTSVPQLTSLIGGSGAVLLPQFVAGGGWASEIVVLNNGTAPMTVRIDLFSQTGSPMVVTLNHQSASTFQNLVIPAGGIVVFAPRNANGDTDF